MRLSYIVLAARPRIAASSSSDMDQSTADQSTAFDWLAPPFVPGASWERRFLTVPSDRPVRRTISAFVMDQSISRQRHFTGAGFAQRAGGCPARRDFATRLEVRFGYQSVPQLRPEFRRKGGEL
ncbi:MAG: hypothetical protein JWO82_2197 [Akkermansiaceae bacterium]|nr:hypothetical protein [Akkermansiaceae bacterium]